MKYTILALTILIFFSSCRKEEILLETDRVSDKTFVNGLRVDGHKYDNLVIENCTFTNKGLLLGEVKNVTVRNCSFSKINGSGIRLGIIGFTEGLRIENCTFNGISENGIYSYENAKDCFITGCKFENMALSDIGGAMGQLHHAIYWTSKNVSISNNHFIAGEQEFSDAISIRSSGIISENIIQDFYASGLTYYSDHPGEDSLVIENNFLFNNSYSMTINSNGNKANHNKNIIVRFNTIVQEKHYSMYFSPEFENSVNLFVYGNIIVNPSETYFDKKYDIPDIYSNLMSPTDIGFIDMNSGNLHLTNTSIANAFCAGLTDYPIIDIDGDIRIQTNLDAGADENN